ncbi:MAG TPA: sigma-70 family RNA polymerase sigma factor [Gemmataceae bacterium]
MSMGHRESLLAQLRRVALHPTGERSSDGQLLEFFIVRRDEAAFEMLLRRHGPMVRGVCLRVLGNAHDADDAFQATFLVLVRKASSVRPRESVGNFLYGVAYRTALEVRKRRTRQRARETSLRDPPQPANESADLRHELRAILDREVSRLSDKYRLPVVLCELEGRSRKEVARQLAIPEGTLSSRLATARKKLAVRLARYGLAISAAALATLFAESTAPASVPAALSMTTTKAALLMAAGPAAGVVSTTVLTLTEGVLKAMFIAKLKTATVVLCGAAVLGLGTGGVLYQTRAGAADPQNGERVVQDRPKRGTDAGQEKEKWRQIAEVAQMREKSLQDQVARLRAELNEWRKRAEDQELQAEAERRRAAEALNAVQRSQGQRDANRTPDRKQDPTPALEKVDAERKHLIDEYKKRLTILQDQRQKLEMEQKQLEVEMQKTLARLDDLKTKIMKEQPANHPKPNAAQKRGGGDKLDQILERLERLEKRLDRLEQGRR